MTTAAEKLPIQEGRGQKETTAIKLVFREGAALAKKHPEIASDYGNGLTYNQIAEKYNLVGLTVEIAENAVRHAISILLSEDKRNQIRKNFLHEKKARGGKASQKKGVGLFALSDVQKSQNGRRGGSISGCVTHEKGVGIFSLSEEERKICNSRAGIYGALANGFIPWNLNVVEPLSRKNEHDYCLHLAEQQEFIHQSGAHIGRPDAKRIALKLNEIFHMSQAIRTPGTIRNRLYDNSRRKPLNVK